MTEPPHTTQPDAEQFPYGDPRDFSLMLGGPLYQLYLRSRIARPPLDLVRRRIIVITAIAWLPLLILSAISDDLIGGSAPVPFLYDIEVHIRFLFVLPLLIFAEKIVHVRIGKAVQQFLDRNIIAPHDMPKFHAAIRSALRLRNSIVLEIVLLIFVAIAGQLIWRKQLPVGAVTWYANTELSNIVLTPAGYWYAFVGVPILQFILLRWYLRIFIWFYFLWQTSRLNLQLIPTHPDRAGGLSFVGGSIPAFGLILIAQGALLSGLIAHRIFHHGQTLGDFWNIIILLVVFFVSALLLPLTMFTPQLTRARRNGQREFGTFATGYVREFRDKWILDGTQNKLTASAELEGLSSLSDSYAVVRDMNPVPFGAVLVIRMIMITAMPLLPLALTIVSLKEITSYIVKLVF